MTPVTRSALREDIRRFRRASHEPRTLGKDEGRVGIIFACGFCGARDSRDAAHSRGCPKLAQGSDAEIYALQRKVAAAWRLKARAVSA